MTETRSILLDFHSDRKKISRTKKSLKGPKNKQKAKKESVHLNEINLSFDKKKEKKTDLDKLRANFSIETGIAKQSSAGVLSSTKL